MSEPILLAYMLAIYALVLILELVKTEPTVIIAAVAFKARERWVIVLFCWVESKTYSLRFAVLGSYYVRHDLAASSRFQNQDGCYYAAGVQASGQCSLGRSFV